MSLVVLAIRLAPFFIVTRKHTRPGLQLTATLDGDAVSAVFLRGTGIACRRSQNTDTHANACLYCVLFVKRKAAFLYDGSHAWPGKE